MKIITPNKKHLCDLGHYLSLKLIFMKFGTRGLSNDVISGTYQTFCEKLLSYWHCSWAHLFEYFNFDNWISNLTCSCKFWVFQNFDWGRERWIRTTSIKAIFYVYSLTINGCAASLLRFQPNLRVYCVVKCSKLVITSMINSFQTQAISLSRIFVDDFKWPI